MEEITVLMQSIVKEEVEVKEEMQENVGSDNELYWNYNDEIDNREIEEFVKHEDGEEEVKPPLMVFMQPACGGDNEDNIAEMNIFEDCRVVKNEEYWPHTGPLDSPTSESNITTALNCPVAENQQNLPTTVHKAITNIATNTIYKCSECKYTTVCLSKLETHCLVHTQNNSEGLESENTTSHEEPLYRHTRIDRSKNKFKCSYCNFRTFHRLVLNVHLRRHTEVVICKCLQCCVFATLSEDHKHSHEFHHFTYRCSECDFGSNSKKAFNHHLGNHQGVRPYKCKQCDFRSKRKCSLKQHLVVHAVESPYRCTQCDYTTKIKQNLKQHLVVHTEERPYRCLQCDYVTKVKHNLKQHSFIHTDDRPYKCTQCNFAAKTKIFLKSHLVVHTAERPYRCKLCDFATKTTFCLNRHLAVHSGERPYRCAQCDFAAKSKYALNNHLAVHSVEQQYKCTQCDFATHSKIILNQHIVTHSQERPYKCAQCNFTAKRKQDLKQHLIVHSVERPYGCAQCAFTAKSKSVLKNHLFIHSGEHRYRCKQCVFSTSSKNNLNKHLVVHAVE